MEGFAVLGPLEVRDASGAPVDLGGRQPRALVAALLAAGGHSVSVDALVEAVWGEAPPISATGTLQSYVSRLRRRLGDRAALRFDDAGYRLDVDPELVDSERFLAAADAGRAALDAGRPDQAAEVLRGALALWRGPAYADFADRPFAAPSAARLDERRLVALEDRLAADLALGHHARAAGELAEIVEAHPLREGLRHQLALALYRSGRQADALRALAAAAATLRDELGIEPSRPLRDLETAILRHDPTLDLPAGPRQAAAGGAGTGGPGTRAPLVGRGDEVAVLLAALDGAGSEAAFVVVEGEAGIGKTRLVDELRAVAEARGSLAVWGRADEGGATPALWPWLAPLRAAAAASPTVPAPVAHLLAGEVAADPTLSAATRIELFESVADLLTAAGANRPVVVLLDDLQWADVSTAELLGFLANRLTAGVLVVCTVRTLAVGRSDEVTDALAAVARRPGSRRIQLRGLGPSDTVELVASTTGVSLGHGVATAVHDRAEGNPFYAIELARLIGEEGGLGGEVPRQVGDVVRRRISHLPPATVAVLGVAAVTGRDVDLGLLVAVSELPIDRVLDDLEPAVAHRVLVPAPENPAVLRFSHALVREVLLDDLTALRRARLHLRVADAIEAAGAGVDDAEILAEHLWRAAPVGVGRRAAAALEAAAEVAVRRLSYAAAEDLLARAVRLRRAAGSAPDDQAAELRATCRLVEVARALGYYRAAVELDVMGRAKELAERTGRTDVLLDLLWVEWSFLVTTGRQRASIPLAQRLRDVVAGSDDPILQAKAIEPWAVVCWQLGRVDEALEHFDRAEELRRGTSPAATFDLSAEQELLARSIAHVNRVIAGRVGPDDALAGFDALVAAQRDPFGIVSVLGFASLTMAVLGRWDDLATTVERGRSADPEGAFAFWSSFNGMMAAVGRAVRGEVDEGIADFLACRGDYLAIAGRTTVAAAQSVLAAVVADNGSPGPAGELVAEAERFVAEDGDRWVLPLVLLAQGAAAGAGGDVDAAAARYGEAAELATGQGAHATAARAVTRLGALRRHQGADPRPA